MARVQPMMEEAIGTDLAAAFRNVRAETLRRADPLSDADATVQSMEDASPAKWHLAHTSWFFETFLLGEHVPGYTPFDPDFGFLFNSYYEAVGPRHVRAFRGMITRPSLDRVRDYRAHVDKAMEAAIPGFDEAARALVTLGLHHEQQHQELLLTDILHLFAQNPLEPAYAAGAPDPAPAPDPQHDWLSHDGGIVRVGHDGSGFAFDCEGPRHRTLLEPFALGSRLVTNAEWQAFIEDGGYRTPGLWLSDGWSWVQQNGIEAPLYWARGRDGGWTRFSLSGRAPVAPDAPVTQISYYEADAFAAWAGVRLPSEAEWEVMAGHPDMAQSHGACWQWTLSAYGAYPGFRPASGAVGEYNGKFMCGQFVLRGSSCATPPGHARDSYRNFFYPAQRWQFTGLRLAKSL